MSMEKNSRVDPDKLIDPTLASPKLETFTQGKLTIEMLPAGYIALNKELATNYHPKLQILLSQLGNEPDSDIRLAVIAHYAGIVLDGEYTLGERDRLCALLSGRLELLREYPKTLVEVIQRPN